jgi:hypothetical protein
LRPTGGHDDQHADGHQRRGGHDEGRDGDGHSCS